MSPPTHPLERPVPSEFHARHTRWVLVQALIWTPLLACIGGLYLSGYAGPWVVRGSALVALVSYPPLWNLCGRGTRPADLGTLLRFSILVAGTVAAAELGLLPWIWFLLVAALLGDLLDGWLARRYGGSESGAILDMETDQFAVLLLSVLGVVVAQAGLWLLALPALKTVTVLLLRARGAPIGETAPVEGSNRRGRWIAAAVMVLLGVVLVPLSIGLLRPVAGLVAVALLTWSFSSDLAHLLPKAARARASS